MTSEHPFGPLQQRPPTPPLSKPPSLLIDIHDSDFLVQNTGSRPLYSLEPRPEAAPSALPRTSSSSSTTSSARFLSTFTHGSRPTSTVLSQSLPPSSGPPHPTTVLPAFEFGHFDPDEDLSPLTVNVWSFAWEFLSKVQALLLDCFGDTGRGRSSYTGRVRLRPEGVGMCGRDEGGRSGGFRMRVHAGLGRLDYGRYLDSWKMAWGER